MTDEPFPGNRSNRNHMSGSKQDNSKNKPTPACRTCRTSWTTAAATNPMTAAYRLIFIKAFGVGWPVDKSCWQRTQVQWNERCRGTRRIRRRHIFPYRLEPTHMRHGLTIFRKRTPCHSTCMCRSAKTFAFIVDVTPRLYGGPSRLTPTSSG